MKKWIKIRKIIMLSLLSLIPLKASALLTEADLKNRIIEKRIENPYYEMGVAYLSGKEIEINKEKALYWLAQSSEIESNNKADYLIAEVYYKGFNLDNKKDLKKSIYFYERSAKRGNKDAPLKLATLLLFNEKVLNTEIGLKWLINAASNDSETAMLLYYGLSLQKKDKESYFKKITYLELKAKKNDKYANFELGYVYFTGKVVQRDLVKSRNYFVKSSKLGLSVSNILIDQIDKIK